MPHDLHQRNWSDLIFVASLVVIYVTSRVFPAWGPVLAGGMVVVVASAVLLEFRHGPRRPQDIGLRLGTLGADFRQHSLFLGPLVLVGIAFAATKGVVHVGHFAFALLLYPVWGLIQQVLFQGIFLEVFRRTGRPYLGLLTTSLLFTAVHYPSKTLMIYTAFGGPLFAWLYLRRPNSISLGLYHGILGALLYYAVRQKDAVAFFFGGHN